MFQWIRIIMSVLKRVLIGCCLLAWLSLAQDIEVQECAATDISIGTDVDTVSCGKNVGFVVGDDTPEVADDPTEADSIVTIQMSVPLTFKAHGMCPEVYETIKCNTLKVSFASALGTKDGSPVFVGGEGAEGLAHWICTESTSEANTYNYYFPIVFDSNAAPGTVNVVSEPNAIQSLLGGSTPGDPTGLEPVEFSNFGEITSTTEIFYFKTAATEFHYVILSDASKVTMQGDQLALVATSPTPQTAAPVCENAVKICFTAACKTQYYKDPLQTCRTDLGKCENNAGQPHSMVPARILAVLALAKYAKDVIRA